MFSTHLCSLDCSSTLNALLVIMVDIHLPYNHCKKSTLRVTLMYPLWSTGSLRVSHVVSPYDRASVVNLMRDLMYPLRILQKNLSEYLIVHTHRVPPLWPPSVTPKSRPLMVTYGLLNVNPYVRHWDDLGCYH